MSSPRRDSASTPTRSRTACRSCSAACASTTHAASPATPTATSIAHALTDAVLGAAGLGDIGSLFPSGASTPEGVDSLELLAEAYRQVREAGYELVNADCVLIGEEPRIASRRDEMRGRLAGALGVEADERQRARDDHRPARLHRPRRGPRRPGSGAAPASRASPSSTATRPSRPATHDLAVQLAESPRPLGDEPERPRAPLAERALERPLLPRRLEPRPARGTRRRAGRPRSAGTRARQTVAPRSSALARTRGRSDPVRPGRAARSCPGSTSRPNAKARRRPCTRRRPGAPSDRPASPVRDRLAARWRLTARRL